MGVQVIYAIVYNLYKQKISDNKESIKELSLDLLSEPNLIKKLIEKLILENSIRKSTAERSIKKLIKKLIDYLSTKKIIKFIKWVYPNNKVVQKIIASKIVEYRKILINLIK